MRSVLASSPSTRTCPESGRISVYSMRSVVVLPAPFGPSRPVISPSRATKLTPATACTLPNDLWRSRTSSMSGLPTVRGDEGRRLAELVQARDVELGGVGGLDELGGEPRHAAARDHDVALALGDEMPAAAEAALRLFAVARRRDRIELPGQQQHRHVAREGLVEIGGALAFGPDRATRVQHGGEIGT